MTAEDKMSRTALIFGGIILTAALCFVVGVGWVFWQIAGHVL